MQIGELARKAECEVETIRYYEREGLLPAPARSQSGYRQYDVTLLGELQFIRHCRSLGISLAEIRTLQAYRAEPQQECWAVNQLLDQHLARLYQQIGSLQQLAQQLEQLRLRCQTSSTVADCAILQGLTQHPS